MCVRHGLAGTRYGGAIVHWSACWALRCVPDVVAGDVRDRGGCRASCDRRRHREAKRRRARDPTAREQERRAKTRDRKSTRLNSSHQIISYAVFCLKKKNTGTQKRAPRRASIQLLRKYRVGAQYKSVDMSRIAASTN